MSKRYFATSLYFIFCHKMSAIFQIFNCNIFWKTIVDKFSKLNKIAFSLEIFTAQFFSKRFQVF